MGQGPEDTGGDIQAQEPLGTQTTGEVGSFSQSPSCSLEMLLKWQRRSPQKVRAVSGGCRSTP